MGSISCWISALTHRQAWQDDSDTLTTRHRSTRTVDDFNHNLHHFRDWADMALAEIGANRTMVRDRHKKITKESSPHSANHVMRARRLTCNLAQKAAVLVDKVQTLENPVRRDVHVFLLLTAMRRRAATGA